MANTKKRLSDSKIILLEYRYGSKIYSSNSKKFDFKIITYKLRKTHTQNKYFNCESAGEGNFDRLYLKNQ